MKNRVGKLRSEIEAPTANIEEAMRFRGAVAEIDSWSRSMDTNLCSVFSKPEQVVLSCSLVTPPLAVLRLVLGSAPTERLCQAISLISDMSSSSTFSSHSAMVNVCVEENEKSLIWIWLVLIAIRCCESAVFVARLKKVDNASEVEDCNRTLEVLSLSILNWKLIIKRWHFQNLRKRIAEMSFPKREYESPMMPLWIVRYDSQCVLHIVCVDRVHTIDKENAQHKVASGLLCSNNSADKWVVVEFVSVEFVDVWEHVSEKLWIEAFCKSCWKWMHVNIEANVLGLFFRSAIGYLKEAGSSLSEELSQLLKFVESRLQLSYGGISLMEELCRLMSQLDLKADFSEFLHFYDFVFFICCYGILWDIMQETPPSSSKRSFHGGSILQLRTGNSDEALQGSVCCMVQALNRGAKKIHVHNEQVSLMRTTADGGIQVEEASFYLTSILSWTYKTCKSSLPGGIGE
nr:Defective-in-cullin neddylation protein [Ipomoea batatas]